MTEIRDLKVGYSDNFTTVYRADVLQGLAALPARSVHMIVTSPPYWALRSYLPDDHPDKAREIGSEPTMDLYIETIVKVMRACWRVLRDDGTLWLNLGDTFNSYVGNRGTTSEYAGNRNVMEKQFPKGYGLGEKTLKQKDLCMIPARVAMALQADGWYLRQEIIWAKPNPRPESAKDRPTSAHEKVYLLTKQPRYFYDAEAIREPHVMRPQARPNGHKRRRPGPLMAEHTFSGTVRAEPGVDGNPAGRNARNVWTIATRPYSGSHYATFPPALVEPCIKAGTSERGVCSVCGDPWRRILLKQSYGSKATTTEDRVSVGFSRNGMGGQKEADEYIAPQTLRWEPTCHCRVAPPEIVRAEFPDGVVPPAVPATVLDPFMGSGTTAWTARRLHRISIGFDLDERNMCQIDERMGSQGVLL